MSQFEKSCTCDEIGEGDCPQHWRENRLQDRCTRLIEDAVILKRNLNEARDEILSLYDEIEKWKGATGLTKGGDPDAVTPEDLQKELEFLREGTWEEEGINGTFKVFFSPEDGEFVGLCSKYPSVYYLAFTEMTARKGIVMMVQQCDKDIEEEQRDQSDSSSG